MQKHGNRFALFTTITSEIRDDLLAAKALYFNQIDQWESPLVRTAVVEYLDKRRAEIDRWKATNKKSKGVTA